MNTITVARENASRPPSRRRSLVAAALCLTVLVAIATSAASATTRAVAGGGTKVTIGMLPVEPTMQAAYADARGFFARQGIDPEITVLADPAQTPAAVLSGTLQFSSFSVGGLATLKARGAPVRLIAAG